MSMHEITLIVNGKPQKLTVKSNELLLNVLRDKLFLTGAKYGCGIAECGACTVLKGDRSVMSCLVPAVAADGWEITTPEGLVVDGELNAVQEELVNKAAIQCGFCTPGMVMSAKALLDRNADPTVAEVREALGGNLCRCTGYVNIEKAVFAAAERMKKGE